MVIFTTTTQLCFWPLTSNLQSSVLYSRKFSRRKLSRICAVPWKFSLRIFWGVTCNTQCRNFWRMCTQGAIFCSINRHVLAQVLSDKLVATKIWWSLSTVVPSSSIVLDKPAEDTDIQARKLHPWGEGTGRKTGHRVQCDSVSSPFLLPIDRWMKIPCVRLHRVVRCSEYRLVAAGYYTWWVWLST